MREASGIPKKHEDLSEQDALRLAEDMRRQVRDLRDKTREYRKAITAASTDKPSEASDKRRD